MKQQKIQENKWFEKTSKKIHSRHSFSKEQLRTLLYELITYYLIETITFQKFLKIIKILKKRSEVATLDEIKKSINLLNYLSKYKSSPQLYHEEIIDTFYKVLTTLLT